MIRRREFITLIGGAAVPWPLAARGQQPAMPVVGFLGSVPDRSAALMRDAFRQGLKDTGYIDGQNVSIEFRSPVNQLDELPALATELVRREVAMIAAPGGPAPVFAAKAATTTIPIVFLVGEDPVGLGLVASLARPGGNLTGINFFVTELTAKRLELLRELVPTATRIAVLVNPSNAANTNVTLRDIESAARAIKLQIEVLEANTSREIDAAFATFAGERPDALFVASSPFFLGRRLQLTHLATRYAIPTVYPYRDYADVGGLISYGTSLTDAMRQVGFYSGRILNGTKPADLPVVQSTKFELVINAQTARMLGLTVSPTLLALADEVIE